MTYIVSNSGISVTEAGRAPLFIPKDHPNFEHIMKCIDEIDYNTFQELADDKSNVVGFINENEEAYINENGDFEVKVDSEIIKESVEEIVKKLVYTHNGMDREDPLYKKAQMLTNVINNMKVSSVRLIFN